MAKGGDSLNGGLALEVWFGTAMVGWLDSVIDGLDADEDGRISPRDDADAAALKARRAAIFSFFAGIEDNDRLYPVNLMVHAFTALIDSSGAESNGKWMASGAWRTGFQKTPSILITRLALVLLLTFLSRRFSVTAETGTSPLVDHGACVLFLAIRLRLRGRPPPMLSECTILLSLLVATFPTHPRFIDSVTLLADLVDLASCGWRRRSELLREHEPPAGSPPRASASLLIPMAANVVFESITVLNLVNAAVPAIAALWSPPRRTPAFGASGSSSGPSSFTGISGFVAEAIHMEVGDKYAIETEDADGYGGDKEDGDSDEWFREAGHKARLKIIAFSQEREARRESYACL
ncbi:hypothetical protein BDK51DRAFT_37875 [Blyttiomyces helicus]|uniref:Uncharacterized protein n=1 Tax=Blyttiomyces helicus TaxID=388810 RepID=A0A4P9W6Z7_9FUNG|nr:hypothetical protein BDK51DRAFT_37875 [Blyttiomyces helicus]|eukprot:RKO86768.1 hypothetical protein BDK51DRAFT_37875 [Blyttiomyces helicus]